MPATGSPMSPCASGRRVPRGRRSRRGQFIRLGFDHERKGRRITGGRSPPIMEDRHVNLQSLHGGASGWDTRIGPAGQAGGLRHDAERRRADAGGAFQHGAEGPHRPASGPVYTSAGPACGYRPFFSLFFRWLYCWPLPWARYSTRTSRLRKSLLSAETKNWPACQPIAYRRIWPVSYAC